MGEKDDFYSFKEISEMNGILMLINLDKKVKTKISKR